MKICLLNSLYPPQGIGGGAEVSIALLAEALAGAGHNVVVISLHPEKEEKCAVRNGVKVYYLPLDNIFWPFGLEKAVHPPKWRRLLWRVIDTWNFAAAKRVARILDAEKPDVLNTNCLTGFSVSVWWAAKWRGIRIVQTLRDYSLICTHANLYRNGRSCKRRCPPCAVLSLPKQIASTLVHGVVGNSRHTLAQHTRRRCFPFAKHQVIFNMSGAAQPSAPPAAPPLVFGFIGRIVPDKGIEWLLKAVRNLPKSGWQLLIAGSGDSGYLAYLRNEFQHPCISWLGYVPADEFYRRIHVLVMPALWADPLPRTIIEAAVRGVPVIASDAGGNAELMALGLRGFTVPAGDVAALTQSLQLCLQMEGFALSNHDEKWREEFTAATVTARYLAVYQTGR
ncbi:MAG TPA: glycosyltransferase family 4 protein [Alphaproteobacteria bacterium]|nr:glycosyltransferase family 4 protein [Alphaproteobacteria bacterium]